MKKWLVFMLLLMAVVAQAATVPDRTPYYPTWWCNARMYGATGDSTADARAAIVSAIACASQTQGGGVELPNGIYRVSDSIPVKIRIPDISGAVPTFIMQGQGWGTKVIIEGAGFLHIAADSGGNGHGRVIIRDMAIYTDIAGSENFAIWLSNLGDFSFENVYISGGGELDKGLQFKGCQQGNITGFCKVTGTDTSIIIDSSKSPTGLSPNSVFANQINLYGANVVGASVTTSIGILIRKAQDGGIYGGHFTNCLRGVDGSAGESYVIKGAHFETMNQHIRLRTGEHWHVEDCEFYVPNGSNPSDIYVDSAARTQIVGNTFNGNLRLGANAVRTTVENNIFNASNSVFDSAANNAATAVGNRTIWQSNFMPTGQQYSGMRVVTQAADSVDLSLLTTGFAGFNINADSSAFMRLSAKGASHDTVGLATRPQYRVGHMGIEFGDSANVAPSDTPPLAAIFSTTSSSYGLGFWTWSGAAVDSLRPRFRIAGGVATPDILFSNMSNVYKSVITADSAYATIGSLGIGTSNSARVLYDPGTISDSLKWGVDGSTADTLTADGAGTIKVIIRSPDTLQVEADIVGRGTGAITALVDTLRPATDNTANLGTSSFRWKGIYGLTAYVDSLNAANAAYLQRAWFGTSGSSWRMPRTAGTDNQVLTLDTDPTPDTAMWITPAGGAENTSAINRGTTADSVFYQESGDQLQFRRLKDSTGVIITPSGDTALAFSVDTVALPLEKYLPLAGGQMTGAVTTSSAGAWDLSSITSMALRAGEIITADLAQHAVDTSKLNGTNVGVADALLTNGTGGTVDWQDPSTAAGGGLTSAAGPVFAVGAGTGITVNANDIAATLGTDIATGEIQNHAVDTSKLNGTNVGVADAFLTNGTSGTMDWQDPATVAGGGLTSAAGPIFAVGAGTGITVNANDIAATLGTDIATAEIQTHAVDTSKLNMSNTGTPGQVLTVGASAGEMTWATAGGGSDNDTGKVLADLGGGAIDRKAEWSGQQLRLEDLTASIQVIQIIAPNDKLYIGDSADGAATELYADSVRGETASEVVLGTANIPMKVVNTDSVQARGVNMTGDLIVTSGSNQTIAVDSVLLGGDQIGEFVGTGLAMSSGSLTATLGTDIALVEMQANSVDSTKIVQQGIHGLDVDSTSNNFIFDNAYSGTSAQADSEYATKNYAKDKSGAKGHWRMPDRWATRPRATGESSMVLYTVYSQSGDSGTAEIWDVMDSSFDVSAVQLGDTLWGLWLLQANEEEIDSILLMLDNEPTANDSSCVYKIQLYPYAGHAMDVSTADANLTTGWVASSANQSFVIDNTDITTADPGELYAVRMILGVTSGATLGRISFNLMAFFRNP